VLAVPLGEDRTAHASREAATVSSDVRRLTPQAARFARVMGALSPEGADPMEVLTAHVYGLVAAAIATAPTDPDVWMARLDAARLAVRDVAQDVRAVLEQQGGPRE
jgi:hypothetical protein